MFYTVAGSVARLRRQVGEMRTIAALPDEELFAVRENVSGWSAAEHLDHLIKVSKAITAQLLAADAATLSRPISIVGRTILALGWIPRGRGRSPERMLAVRSSRAELQQRLEDLDALVAQLSPDELRASTRAVVKHPYFGGLTPPQAVRFNAVHTAHHLRIVSDLRRRR